MPALRVQEQSNVKPNIKAKNVPNPHNIYSEIMNILVDRINISKNDINEEKYEHSKKEVEKVHTEIEATKPMDKFTSIVLEIEINMTLKPIHKEEIEYVGDLSIQIAGFVRTDYPQDTALQKSILWNAFRSFYEKALYGDIKGDYMNLCTKYVRNLRDELKRYLNLLPEIT